MCKQAGGPSRVVASGCADDGASPSLSAEGPPLAPPASAATGSEPAAIPPATSVAGPPAATPLALVSAAVGAAGAQAPSAQPRRPTKPLAEHLDPLKYPVNLGSNAPSILGGAFSFMCVVRMDSFNHWCRVFDFSNLEADSDSITAGAIGLTRDLHFTIFQRKQPYSVTIDDFFEPGHEFTMMCTVSESGHMKVLKNGVLVGENPHGMVPLSKPRPRMIVGGHFKFRAQVFRGSLRDVKIWDGEVSWTDAARG